MCVLVTLLCAVQDGKCFYCGGEFTGRDSQSIPSKRSTCWSKEHVMPVSKGGKLYVLACVRCNGKKGCRMPTPEELRRAVVLRSEVDKIGRAYQGESWTTFGEERLALKRVVETGIRKRPSYRCPKVERPSHLIAEALREAAA